MRDLRAESLAIFLLLVIFILSMLKTKWRMSALLTTPVLGIPLSYLITDLVLSLGTDKTHTTRLAAFTWAVWIGAGVTIVLGFILSHFLAKRKSKIFYTVFCVIFALCVGFAYLYNLY